MVYQKFSGETFSQQNKNSQRKIKTEISGNKVEFFKAGNFSKTCKVQF